MGSFPETYIDPLNHRKEALINSVENRSSFHNLDSTFRFLLIFY